MDDIAREMGMSKKTLYQSVKDKNELVESVVNYNMKLYETFLSAFYSTDLNALEQFFTFSQNVQKHFPKYNPSMLYDLRKYYPTLLNKVNSHKHELVYKANIANLDKGIKEGYYYADIDSTIVAKMQVGFQSFFFDPSYGLFSDAELTNTKTIEQLYKYHFRGICTPKGIEELKRIYNYPTTKK